MCMKGEHRAGGLLDEDTNQGCHTHLYTPGWMQRERDRRSGRTKREALREEMGGGAQMEARSLQKYALIDLPPSSRPMSHVMTRRISDLWEPTRIQKRLIDAIRVFFHKHIFSILNLFVFSRIVRY